MTYREHMEKQAKDYLTSVLQAAGGSPTEAAKLAGLNRTAFLGMLIRYGVREKKKPRFWGNWGDLTDNCGRERCTQRQS